MGKFTKFVCALATMISVPLVGANAIVSNTWEELMQEYRPHLPHNKNMLSLRADQKSALIKNSSSFDDSKAIAYRTLGNILPDSVSWRTSFRSEEERIDVCEFMSSDGASNSFAVYAQLGNFSPYYWTVNGLSSGDGVPSKDFLERNCRVHDSSAIQCSAEVLSAAEVDVRELGARDVVSIPYSRFWFFFVNDSPKSNWAHPCRYIFVSEDQTSFTVLYRMMPPRLFSRATSDRIRLRALESKNVEKVETLENVKSKVFGYAQNLKTLSANSISYTTGNSSKSYFVLISGGADPESNGIRFWCDTAMLYSTLTLKYGVSKDNIYVYMSDGTSSAEDANLGDDDNPVLVSSPLDLDGDGNSDIDGAATKSNVSSCFSSLRSRLTADDQLFVFVTSHGSPDGTAGVNNYGCLAWLFSSNGSYAYFWDEELASWTSGFSCPVAFAIETCYSGGFIDDITATANRVIATACNNYESSFGSGCGGAWGKNLAGMTTAANCWAKELISALRGVHPRNLPDKDGLFWNAYPWQDDTDIPINADSNNDGLVCFNEARNYAYANDEARCTSSSHPSWCSFAYDSNGNYYNTMEHPQYAESTSGLGNGFFVLKQAVSITYSVSYSLNGGTHGATHPSSATYDTAFYVSAPSRTGYTFAGWTVTSGLDTSTAKWGTTSSPSTSLASSSTKCVNGATGNVYFKNLRPTSGSVTLTANWTANSYSVAFNKQNGSGGSSSVTATYGSAMPSITKPTRDGYMFGGYYTGTNGSGTQYYNAAGVSARTWNIANATTLYAYWIATVPLPTALDNSSLNFTTGGSANWVGISDQFYYGGSSAMSGAITHSQSTWMQTEVPGEGTLSFWYKVSSESSYDKLLFYIDGTSRLTASGTSISTWQQFTCVVSNSTQHVFKWTYSKDGSVSSGSDCCWIDKVEWTPVTYTVAYNPGSYGTGSQQTAIKTNNVALVLKGATFTRTGYTQTGWATSDGGSKAYDLSASYTANAAIMLYPYWTPNTYSISYSLNSGTHGTTHPSSATYDTAFYVSAPSKTGYTFTGWTVTSGLNTSTAKWGTTSSTSTSLTSTTTKCVNGATGNVYFKNLRPTSGSVTLTANWQCNHSSTTIQNARSATCTVTGYTGDRVCSTCGAVVEAGTTIAALGHQEGAGVVTQEPTTTAEGVMTYSCTRCGITMRTEAIPKVATYTVAYNPGSYGIGSQQTAAKTNNVALVLKGATFTRTGYTQTGWATSDGGTKTYDLSASYTANAAITLYPYWTANTYTVSYSLNGGTHGATHPTSATYDTAFYVSAPSKTGYTFTGWTVTSGLNTSTAKWETTSSTSTSLTSTTTKCVNGATGNVYFKNLRATSGSVTLTANWQCNHSSTTIQNARSATCTVVGYTGDRVCSTCGTVVEYGTTIAALGHQEGAGVVTQEPTATSEGVMAYSCTRCGITMRTEAIPKVATYTVAYNPGSYGIGSQQTAAKTNNVALVLKGATFTRTGYTQTGWATSDGGSKAYDLSASYTANAAITLYPYWTPNTYSISYSLNSGTHGTTHPSSATYDTAFYVSAPSRTYYTFAGWTVTSGLDTSTAKWGTTSSASTSLTNSITKCVNGTTGSVYFKNLRSTSGSVTLTANWTGNTYGVTLNKQGGSGGTANVTATFGSAMPSITIPIRDGYTFGGYYTSTNGVGTQYYTTLGSSSRAWDRVSATTLYAKWLPTASLSTALDNASLDFTTGGNADWTVVADASAIGGTSARSGAIAPEKSTWVQTTVSGAGTLSFRWKADCEKDPRNRYTYDLGAFAIDGNVTNRIDGTTAWQTVTVETTEGGAHVLRWTYSKDDWDEDDYTGEDCIWVDHVVWTPRSASAGLAAWLAAQGLTAESRAANGRTAEECYMLGLDPTDETNDFRIVSIEMVDGKPKVEWEPKVNRWTGAEIQAVLMGATRVDGPWAVVPEGGNPAFRFFKAVVSLEGTVDTRAKVQLWAGGPYWAETNIGAEVPWESGYYFWWGDIVGYTYENNAWVATDGSSLNFSFSSENVPTYGKRTATLQSEGWITADGVLAPEHDAAQVQWGGGWRMPTTQELSALVNNCDWTWTTKNGVNGYEIRGRGDYASNSIFLPCSGYGYGASLRNSGSDGNYWSSVPYSDTSGYFSRRLYFDSGSRRTSSYGRYYGQSVRPVQGFTE